MTSPVARYHTSRRYIVYAVISGVGAALSAWAGTVWGANTWSAVAWLSAVISFLVGAFSMMALALRPAIEVHRGYLAVGRHIVFWNEIQRIDRTRWIAPLLVRLTLAGDRRVFLLYAGNQDSSMELLRHLFLQSHGALLDGIPHAQFWGETSPSSASEKRDSVPSIASRGRLLLPEDEAEVERLFQRLKTAGRLDQHGDSREAGPSGSRPRGGSRE